MRDATGEPLNRPREPLLGSTVARAPLNIPCPGEDHLGFHGVQLRFQRTRLGLQGVKLMSKGNTVYVNRLLGFPPPLLAAT